MNMAESSLKLLLERFVKADIVETIKENLSLDTFFSNYDALYVISNDNSS